MSNGSSAGLGAPVATRSWAGIIVGVIAVIVVLALIMAMLARHPSPSVTPSPSTSPPSAEPSPPADWAQPFSWCDAGANCEYAKWYNLSTDGLALVKVPAGNGLTKFGGVSLRDDKMIWTTPAGNAETFFGDDTVFAVEWLVGTPENLSHTFQFIDPNTGATIAQTTVDHYTHLLWAGQGMIITGAYGSGMCAAKAETPTTCLWKANITSIPTADQGMAQPYVFAGQWVNTADGVVSLATGQKAPFGGDSGSGDGIVDDAVYYCGDTPDRVFRVVDNPRSGHQTSTTFQPWDTTTDAAVSPAVRAFAGIQAPEGLPQYIAEDCANGECSITAYDWATGAQLWNKPLSYPVGWTSPSIIYGSARGYFVGSNYVTQGLPPNVLQAPDHAYAYDATTGETAWQGFDYSKLTGMIGNVAYITQDGGWAHVTTLTAFDATEGFKTLWETPVPPSACGDRSLCGVMVVANMVIFLDDSGNVWVLNR